MSDIARPLPAASLPLPPSAAAPRSVTILGATGSVGQSTLDLVRADLPAFRVEALVAGRQAEALAQEAKAVGARLAVVADPEAYSQRITHAGAIFLGAWTPEAIGDYVGGPNHVLPTARSARFSSGLSVMDFIKRTTMARMTPASLRAIGPAAEVLARSESLEAHGLSVTARLTHLNDG